MSLAVIHPGFFSTIQDLGRRHHRAFGVPVGGAFDVGSALLANALTGNEADAAVIEMTIRGGTFESKSALWLALAGAPMPAGIEHADGRETALTIPSAFPLQPSDRLTLGPTAVGARTYLAVSGGWLTPLVLDSRSSETPLKVGDELPCSSGATPIRRVTGSLASVKEVPVVLRVVDGPDSGQVGSTWLDEGWEYRVDHRSDRMGVRLGGRAAPIRDDPERLSTPVAPGAVQMPGGLPMVLGVACGTMGGYPHVAHVIRADLDRVGQLRPGVRVRFERIDRVEARIIGQVGRKRQLEEARRIRLMVGDAIGR